MKFLEINLRIIKIIIFQDGLSMEIKFYDYNVSIDI